MAISLDYLDAFKSHDNKSLMRNAKESVNLSLKYAEIKFQRHSKNPTFSLYASHSRIFKPKELDVSLSDEKISIMCWELCEHFFMDDYLISKILFSHRLVVNFTKNKLQ